MKTPTHKYIAVGPYAYGMSTNSQIQAIRRMRSQVPSHIPSGYGYKVYKAHPDSTVDPTFGGIVYPTAHPPELIKEKKRKN